MSVGSIAPAHSKTPRRRARSRGVGLALLLMAGLLMGTTGVSFLAAESIDFGNFSTIVKPQDRSGGLPSGKRAEVTTLSGTFPLTQGKPAQADGVQMFRVKIAELKSDEVSLHYAWLNAQDANAVLKNPHT